MSDHEEDFERMLEESLSAQPPARSLQLGQKIRATVVAVSGEYVLVDLGGKTEGIMDKAELLDEEGRLKVGEGDEIEARVSRLGEEIRLSQHVRPGAGSEEVLEEAYQAGIPVEGRVTGQNKGGLEVEVAGKRAFCPISQIELGFCEDPSVHVGERLQFRVTRLERGNVVLSRRAVLEEARESDARETRKRLRTGEVFEGVVTRVAPFGVFVDIGGLEGLVHVSEISHERVEDPSERIQNGQRVTVQVVSIDEDSQRIGLSLRALEADPWDEAIERFPRGSLHEGRVVRLAPYGAFVALGGGIEGLAHVSELSDKRIGHPREVVAEGETVTVRIIEVDKDKKRVSLSLREERPDAPVESAVPGDVVAAVVERVESFGLLVRFGGNRGLIPLSELPAKSASSPRALKQAYPEGSEVRAEIIEVDEERGRVRLSAVAAKETEARAEFQAYQDESKKGEIGTSLGDLLRSRLKPSK